MKIVVIDGQGGRIGSLVTARLCKEQLPNCELYAIGTNATATAAMLKAGEITQEEYDRWRYRYPEFDTTQRWAKVPSQELSDMLIEALKEGNE